MSVTSMPNKRHTTTSRSLLIATMAVIVVSLQIGLPWLSCSLVHDPERDAFIQVGLDLRGFWERRLSFDRFLNPTAEDGDYRSDAFAMAVCGDELVVIRNPNLLSSTTERIDLRTGRVTSSPTPHDIVSVASDGRSLHWINVDSNWGDVVLWEGRPVRFQPKGFRDSDATKFTYEMMDLVEGRWQPANRFVLIPSLARDVDFTVDAVTGKLCCFAGSHSDDRLWFQCDLSVDSEEEHALALTRYLAIETGSSPGGPTGLDKLGWRSMPTTEWVSPWDVRWVEGNAICKLGVNHYPSKEEPEGRVWTRFFEEDRIEHQFVALPVRAQLNGYDHHFQPVSSADGSIYFVSQSTFDQRWTVLRWDNGRFQILLDQHSPLLALTCVDAASFSLLMFLIPLMVLWCLSALVQARMPHPSRIAEQEALASISRRGLAKAIDVVTWGLPLLLAFILHPEVIDWWRDLIGAWTNFKWAAMAVVSQPTWGNLIDLRRYLFAEIQSQFPLPTMRPLADIAIAIFLGQTIWQCVSGQTLGKWLLGIKVVRSDLRRCSWGRSCLREALFFVDSLLLLSWVPGVVSMLLTSKSQRIGDWVTDTIVVRAKRSP